MIFLPYVTHDTERVLDCNHVIIEISSEHGLNSNRTADKSIVCNLYFLEQQTKMNVILVEAEVNVIREMS